MFTGNVLQWYSNLILEGVYSISHKKTDQMTNCYKLVTLAIMSLFCIVCCAKEVVDVDMENPSIPMHSDIRYPVVESEYLPLKQSSGDMIPDFSRVGYHWGDVAIPHIEVVKKISPPVNGGDATQLIQDAINSIDGGAILLQKGVYKIAGVIVVDKSGVVLRGEGCEPGSGTTLIATGAIKRNLITIKGHGRRVVKDGGSSGNIKDDLVPVGQFWVRVKGASKFKVGDDVVVYRPSTKDWIEDVKMDCIPPRPDGGVITQWRPGYFDLYSERVITLIKGDTIHFENPIVMSLDKKYGGGRVLHYSYEDRIEECGVENMYIESEYASMTDEHHGWIAISISVSQHCWVQDIKSQYFGMGLVSIEEYSKNITVQNCECLQPISKNTGGRRYSFYINNSSLCLIRNCRSESARHDYATGSLGSGPNVFHNCEAKATLADVGPHHRWNVGTLYDNIKTDGAISIQDRSSYGSGQGWAGANNVLWNCVAQSMVVQTPWASAYNYSIGNVGEKNDGRFQNPKRPDGVWRSHGSHVEPYSLYLAQLELRCKLQPGGVMDVK